MPAATAPRTLDRYSPSVPVDTCLRSYCHCLLSVVDNSHVQPCSSVASVSLSQTVARQGSGRDAASASAATRLSSHSPIGRAGTPLFCNAHSSEAIASSSTRQLAACSRAATSGSASRLHGPPPPAMDSGAIELRCASRCGSSSGRLCPPRRRRLPLPPPAEPDGLLLPACPAPQAQGPCAALTAAVRMRGPSPSGMRR